MMVHSAKHVYREIGYAKTQRNNHAITESIFLMLFGSLFRGNLFANKCIDRGEKTLEFSLEDQFFSDGIYIQNSFTYQRFALQSLVLAYEMLQNGKLKEKIRTVFKNNLVFLFNITFGKEGDFPNYGPNEVPCYLIGA
jgi:hypothetical protein